MVHRLVFAQQSCVDETPFAGRTLEKVEIARVHLGDMHRQILGRVVRVGAFRARKASAVVVRRPDVHVHLGAFGVASVAHRTRERPFVGVLPAMVHFQLVLRDVRSLADLMGGKTTI